MNLDKKFNRWGRIYFETEWQPYSLALSLPGFTFNFSINWSCFSDHLPLAQFWTSNLPPKFPTSFSVAQGLWESTLFADCYPSLSAHLLVALGPLFSSYQIWPVPFVSHSPLGSLSPLAGWQQKKKLDMDRRNSWVLTQFLPDLMEMPPFFIQLS